MSVVVCTDHVSAFNQLLLYILIWEGPPYIHIYMVQNGHHGDDDQEETSISILSACINSTLQGFVEGGGRGGGGANIIFTMSENKSIF